MAGFVHHFLNLLLPPRCPMTGKLVGETGALDPSYWVQLNFIQRPFCACCGTPFAAMDGNDAATLCGKCLQEPPLYTSARAALKYDDASAKLVLRFKHADGTVLAPLLTKWLLQSGREQLEQTDIILSVPLHRWRLLRRRYNQAALLAQGLARTANKPHWPQALLRIKATESQGHKTKAQRHDNIRGVFKVAPRDVEKLKGKRVLLIDDVLTSGATVNECAKALYRDADVAEVHVLTVCRIAHNDWPIGHNLISLPATRITYEGSNAGRNTYRFQMDARTFGLQGPSDQ